jgi:hypothetical protein
MLRLTTAIAFLLVPAPGAASDSRAGGLERRVAIPVEDDRDGLRPLVLAPADTGTPGDSPSPAEGLGLAERIDLRLRPARLQAPVEPGQRRGHGNLDLALPLAGPFELRPGVRVDYQNRPADDAWELDGTPMLGLGVRF